MWEQLHNVCSDSMCISTPQKQIESGKSQQKFSELFQHNLEHSAEYLDKTDRYLFKTLKLGKT
jgi:hypothetical protein